MKFEDQYVHKSIYRLKMSFCSEVMHVYTESIMARCNQKIAP